MRLGTSLDIVCGSFVRGAAAYLVWVLVRAVRGTPGTEPAGTAGISAVRYAALITPASAPGRWLRRSATVRGIDGITGTTLIGFGVRPAVTR